MADIIELVYEGESQRADVYLSTELGYTRSYIKQLCEKGCIFLNSQPIKKCGVTLVSGNRIKVEIPVPKEISARPQDIPLDIVYEDSSLLVINKAQGMVTHPSVGSPCDTLVNALMFHSDKLSTINGEIRPGIVHRLDKNTSGLLVVAKTDSAHQSLSKQIETKTAVRQYIALVDGNIKEDEGIVEQPIGRSQKDRKLMAVVEDGRYAKTLYKVVERFGKYTLVEFTLKTGRTHQIRVHSKFIKHPVVGDEAYCGSNEFGLKGQLLHAYRLSFDHPETGERMVFTAPLPDYFKKVLNRLGSKTEL